MNYKGKFLAIVMLILLTLSLVACEKEGAAEKAGKKFDKILDSAKDKVKEATK